MRWWLQAGGVSILGLVLLTQLPAQVATPGQPLIKKEGQSLKFQLGDVVIGEYLIAPEQTKPHFHPLLAMHGKPITRAFPMVKDVAGETKDHVHHRAAWFCHGDVIPEGLELKHKIKNVAGVDFWSEQEGHGRIVCTKVEMPRQSLDTASVATSNEWRTADGVKILDEARHLSLHLLQGGYLIVFDVDLRADAYPITFGDTKEGSMAVRVADEMTEQRKQGRLENSHGQKSEKECWGKQAAWCDYSGPVQGQEAGLALFDHPKNAAPAAWHARGYGLMAANPFGRARSGFSAVQGKTELVKLAKGDHLKLRYGLFVHPGDATVGKVAEAYAAFAKLP